MPTVLFAVLLATPPAPCDEPAARAFDFWIGEWNVNNRWRTDAGWVDAGAATNQVFHVLNGCAVVELWDGFLGDQHIRGFSVRAWDPQAQEWVLVLNWPQPDRAQFGVLRGSFRHGRGDFFREGTTPDGLPLLTRYTFSDITDRSLRWNDGTSMDSGRTWATRWIMEFVRRDPRTDPPLRNAPLADPGRTRLCAAPRARAFDAYLGAWRSTDASLHSMAIVGECAILDQLAWDADGTHHEALLVRASSPDGAGWVQYAIDTDSRQFVRYTGAGPELMTGPGGETIRWTLDGDTLRLEWTGARAAPLTFSLVRVR